MRKSFHMYKWILFDLDGTLTDSGEGIINSAVYALKKYNIDTKDRSELKKFIGPPLHDSFKMFYGFSEEESIQAVKYFREYYSEKGIFENRLYGGIAETLEEIKKSGRKIALATSKAEKFALRVLEHFDIEKYFDFIAGSIMDGRRSSKAEIISFVLNNCAVQDLSQAVMIGDREHDIYGAENAGIDSIGVLYGYGSKDELISAGADFLAETPAGILKYI